jgi:hypothetical protein
VTKLVVESPLAKLDLGDQNRLDPMATSHNRRGNALTPAPGCFLLEVHEGARWRLIFCIPS